MKKIPVRNPRNGEIDFQLDCFESQEVTQTANALRATQQAWQEAGIEHRCHNLSLWRDQLDRHRNKIAEALCVDTGRRFIAHYEVQKVIELIDYWTELAPSIMTRQQTGQSQMVASVTYRHKLIPYSLVGIISPWNVPLILSLIDSIPALLAGSAVLLKPSEVTPRFISPLSETISQVEGLSSVLSIASGASQTGASIIDHVDALCFTGSVATGRKVAAHSARNFIPAFLELGGKDPAIVMASADLDNACSAIVRSAIGLTGQACQSLERVYVDSSVFEPFLKKLISHAERVELNWPNIDRGHIGPLIFADQSETIQHHIHDALEQGAVIHCGGTIETHGGGRWCLPTVITQVNHKMRLLREETFGPIIPVIPFDTIEQAVCMANDSEFGLSASVFSATRQEAEALAEQINVGAISINDASLTSIVNDIEKNSFCLSGLGGSRMGEAGLTRFLRKRAIMYQSTPAAAIDVFCEGQLG